MDVRKERGVVWSKAEPADREVGVEDLAGVRKLIHFFIIPVCFENAPYG